MPIKFSQFTNRTSDTPTTTIVGFDGNQNIKILSSDLLSGFINGTPNTIPVFATTNTIGDSIISQDASATQLFVNGKVGIGRTLLPGGPNLEVYSTGNPFADIRSVQAGGSSFQGARIYLTAEDTVANKQGQVDINIHGPSHSTEAYSFEIANTSNPTSTTGGDIFFSSRPAGSTIELVRFKEDGQVQFNQYGAGAFTGTAEKTLAVDANGNIIETPGVTVDGSGSANYITKWLDQDTITDSIIYEDTDGHVGIGVPGTPPDPEHKFEVYDSRAENTAGDYSMIVSSELASPFSNGAGGLKVQLSTDAGSTFPSAISLVTGTTSSELMATTKLAFFSNSDLNTSSATGFGGFVTHDGTNPHWQLGGAVTDSAPSETLFVDGQTRGRSSSFPVYFLERETAITGDGTFTSPSTGIASGFHLRTNSSSTIQDGFGGGVVFSLTDAGSTSNVAARIYARRDGADTTGALQFWGGLDGTSSLMTMRASGDVGIGTDDPATKLEVEGTDGNFQTTGHQIFLTKNGVNEIYAQSGANPGLSALALGTNSAERMRISSTGNVGIGTLNPLHDLQIGDGSGTNSLQVSSGTESALYLTTPNSTAQSVIGFGNNQFATINTRGRILYQSSTSPSGNYMEFKVAFNEIMRLTNSSMGIGTTTPSSKLQVNGAVQVGDDTGAASADKVGALRYRTSGNNSYVDMCMQTDASTYAWVNIVQNNW